MPIAPKILLVDDEAVFLEIISMKLSANGFETMLAKSGEEALAKLELILPDLVLSDIHMAPMNGWELALQVRRNPKTHALKIAFLTSLQDPWAEFSRENREQVTEELGTIPIFSKADDLSLLPKKVSEIIGPS